MRRFLTWLLILIILVGGGFAIWWFASGQNNKNTPANTTTMQTPPSAQQQIKTNWVKFFNGSTTAQEKANLLQNGQQFAQVIQGYYQQPAAKTTSATVSKVQVNGNSATVTYTVSLNGQPALTNQTGQAIYTNGAWKVSDASFCDLLKLGGTLPPVCPGGSSQQPAQGQTQTQTPPQTNQ